MSNHPYHRASPFMAAEQENSDKTSIRSLHTIDTCGDNLTNPWWGDYRQYSRCPKKLLGASPQRTGTPTNRDLPSHLYIVGYTNARSVREDAEISNFCQTHQLDVDYLWDVAQLRNSWLWSSHSGMTIYRTDRIGRLGGGTALYVSDYLHSFPTRDPVLNSLTE